MIMDLNTQITTLSKSLDFGTHKKKCPSCQHTRTKHKHDTPLSLSVSSECTLYRCHHCGIEGKIWDKDDKIFFKQLNTKSTRAMMTMMLQGSGSQAGEYLTK